MKTVGEYYHVGKALELLEKYMLPSIKLQLSMANICRSTSSRLRVLCNTCTNLNRLTIINPLHSPLMLSELPKTLTILSLHDVPTKQTWLDGLYKFLSGPRSHILRKLFIKFQINTDLLKVDFFF